MDEAHVVGLRRKCRSLTSSRAFGPSVNPESIFRSRITMFEVAALPLYLRRADEAMVTESQLQLQRSRPAR